MILRSISSVGILDLFTGRTRGLMSSVTLPVNPYTPAPTWPQIVVDDLFGDDLLLPMTRAEAIRIPAVSAARNLLISTIGQFPLRAIRSTNGADTDVTTNFPWLYRSDGDVSPYMRMVWTVDDGIFYGCSLWELDRSAPDKDGRRAILDARWVPFANWSIKRDENNELRVYIDDVPIAWENLCLIDFPFEGLLTVGARTLKGARDIEESWVGRARNPIPLIELKMTDEARLQPGEIEDFVDAFAKARTDPNGAIGYTPQGVELVAHGTDAADLSVEGRNAVRTDVGSHVRVRASMLDGTMGIDSLTYTTTAGEKNAFYEFDLPFWTRPIEERLSMDDMVPRGTRVRFDKYSEYNQAPATGPQVED